MVRAFIFGLLLLEISTFSGTPKECQSKDLALSFGGVYRKRTQGKKKLIHS